MVACTLVEFNFFVQDCQIAYNINDADNNNNIKDTDTGTPTVAFNSTPVRQPTHALTPPVSPSALVVAKQKYLHQVSLHCCSMEPLLMQTYYTVVFSL
jgi:hypothetical protein